MSSIVIAGDTSGSVTLQAPAVAGSTVLNLPATSGTIQTSGSGYTTNGVAYASSTSALTTGSALTFDGTSLQNSATNAKLIALNIGGTGGGGLYLGSGASTDFILNFDSTPYVKYNSVNSWPHTWTFGATEAMRLTSTGLGIGTSSPANILDISSSNGTNYAASSASLSTPAGGSNAYLTNTANGGFATLKFQSTNSSAAIGYFGFYNTSGSFTGAFVWGQRTGSTSYAEQARIDSSGNLLVGVTSGTYHTMYKDHADWALMARNGNANPYGVAIRYSGAAPNGAVNNFLEMYDTSTTRAKFTSNGGLANYSANNVNLSDRREKTNFAPAGSYLDKICAIPVQTYNYIDQNLEQDDGLTLGVVAQDVQAVAPELVNESNWGSEEEPKMRLSIYQTDLQYALMKCIQEQQALINTLTERISVLENK